MPAPSECRHFIPVPTGDLVRLMAEVPEMDEVAQTGLACVARLTGELLHRALQARLEESRAAYAPFDPDSDALALYREHAAERQRRLNTLLRDLNWLLARAHFHRLGREELEPLLDEQSDFCPRMQVDFTLFEHLSIFVRAEDEQPRILRNWRTLFFPREEQVPVFRRLVLVLKFRPSKRLAPNVDPDHVYLKLFKDIPSAGLGMLMPGARVRINLLDRGKIGAGLLSGLGTMAWRMISDLGHFLQNFENATLGLFAGAVGYAFKSYSDWQVTRQAYHLNLTESLYFQNLDSNAGVISRLLEEAEQQQTRAALLAYYCLWRYHADGATRDELATSMDLFLDRYAEWPALCEAGEAAEQLLSLGIAVETDCVLKALPPDRAIPALRLRHGESSGPP